MLQNLNNACWQHSNSKAELIKDGSILIEMEFSRKATYVTIGKLKYNITITGFWIPKITINENDKIIAQQKHANLWSTKSEFDLDGETYTTKTKLNTLINFTYCNSTGDILTYKLDTLKRKPIITFEIKSFNIPEKHLMLLLALGFYSIRSVAIETMSDDFIVVAVS